MLAVGNKELIGKIMLEAVTWRDDMISDNDFAEQIIKIVSSPDKARLDWLSNPNNLIGNVTLPKECVENNLGSLRDAIDAAMELYDEGSYYKSFDNATDLIKHLKINR